METLIISGDDKKSLFLLDQLALKLGLKSKPLSKEQTEDFLLAEIIDKGMKSGNVSQDSVMEELIK